MGVWLLAFITLQRAAELVLARRNTRRLLERGAHEVGAGHYPLIVGFHATWLACLWWFGWDAQLDPIWTAVFVLLQVMRVWTIWSLGERWTTRIIVLDAPLVRRGPYRLFRHPNYVIVAAELVVVPLAMGLGWLGLLFFILHLPLIRYRIAVEAKALVAGSPGEAGAATRSL